MDGLTLGHVAATNARKFPDDVCLIEETEAGIDEITFEAFNARTDRIAHVLRDRGIDADSRVAIYMGKNVEMIESCYAAMKLGAIPVPINHRFKSREIEYVLQDSDSRLCLFDESAADRIDEVQSNDETPDEYLYVGSDRPEYASNYHKIRDDAPTDPIDVVPTRLDTAALIYTSGTTGKPKGCVLTHENLLSNTNNSIFELGFDKNKERYLLTTPLFHVGGFQNLNTQMYLGSATYLLDSFDPVRTLDIIDEHELTGGVFVPTMSRQLLGVDDLEQYDLSSFEHYVTGGAASGEELKRRIISELDVQLHELYAQTEALGVTYLRPANVLEKSDSIGRPVITMDLKIVDEEGEEVDPGGIGRGAYRGPTVFQGYLEMPERTAAVFDDEGYFVSGDLLRRDEDGFVYFVGRYDDMIVSGGENIHPAEIEEVLHAHPEIDEAAIVGVPDETWGERVKAVIVQKAESDLTEDAVTSFVGERLAGYKKPREVEFRSSLPRNPAGKVLKQQLS